MRGARTAISALMAVLAGEWLRQPGWLLASATGLCAAAALILTWRAPGTPAARLAQRATGLVCALLAAMVLVMTGRLLRVENDWSAVRERAVTRASERLDAELDQAVAQATALASRAAPALSLEDAEAFGRLAALGGATAPSHGVVLFDTHGHLRAWSGLHRVWVRPEGPELSAITTPFYLWLVARRQTSAGTAAAIVLLARGDDVPRAGIALTDEFARRTGVGLRFLDARLAPADSGVFDYVAPGSSGRDTLFAVQPVPPPQHEVYGKLLKGNRRAVLVIVAVLLALTAAAASRAGFPLAARLLPAGAALALLARAPLRDTFGPNSPFWPGTYYAGLLMPFSASAGALVVLGIVAFALACSLWRRGLKASWLRMAIAAALTLLAPYVLQRLARGITPPPGGVSVPLWLLWQSALALSASALVLFAASLVRGTTSPTTAGRRPYVAGIMAAAAALAGIWLWQPAGAWPDWYPYLWAPALLLLLLPMPIRTAVVSIAVVAGTSAALLTWGATNEGRMRLATRDVEGLGDRTDPLAVALLERLVLEVPADSAPLTAGDLFVLWRRSSLGAEGYPASLGVWTPALTRVLALDLAELDVPDSLVRTAAAEALERGLPLVRPALRVPGVHAIAAIPLRDGRILTMTVGPRSRLVAPTRLAEFLLGTGSPREAPYEIALGPPGPGAPGRSGVAWQRDGWQLRGERLLDLPGGPRHAHAIINLRGPSAVLQRGALVLVFDIILLFTLWSGLELASGRAVPALTRWWGRVRRSLRLRLSVSLALFFMVPTIVFALWSFGRLEEEFRGARELLLHRTLRDAAAALGPGQLPADALVTGAARQVGAELLFSRGGRLRATSAPVLADLGLVDLLVPDPVYTRLVHGDEIEATAPQQDAPAPTLVGFRLLGHTDPDEPAILAAPEFLGDPSLRRREADLGIAVLAAGLAGCLAAIVLSGLAAQWLARPIDQLRRAARTIGAGTPPTDIGALPAELQPIRRALAQAARDVESGQRAQRVLAWGEMARQIAHEIKNPLTPIRLGVQHLLRLGRERPGELGGALPDTGGRILAEIDRLDAIARAFSRLALPGSAMPDTALEDVDVAGVVRDVVQLYQMGEGRTAWRASVDGAPLARARRDELVEVLVNLCENARDAGAHSVEMSARMDGARVMVLVKDDGRGISPEVLPRVFEPRFSTNTSGSGLGLAIAKRLVESWGGEIGIASTDGAGTTVRFSLNAA